MRGRFFRAAGGLAAMLAVTALTLALANLLLWGYAAVYLSGGTDLRVRVEDYAPRLTRDGGGAWTLPRDLSQALRERGCWAMLIDDAGRVAWSQDMPDELPQAFSHQEVAAFARWYLDDWPVQVWRVRGGLFVLAQPKGSVWKYGVEIPMNQFAFWPLWLLAALMMNAGLLFAAAAGMTRRARKRRDDARSEWIAAVSHDVRTPLSMVLGYAGTLEAAPGLAPETRRMAGLIREKGMELRGLIADLNLTNRLEYAMQPVKREWLPPAAMAREVAAAILNENPDGSTPIDVNAAPGVEQARLYGDRQLLGRMLQNLIRNSIRHNPGGCAVTVALTVRGRRLTISVTDTGRGFSGEQLSRLASGAKASAESGHGLGLRIARRVAEAHGGRASFENVPGGGARCVIRGLGPVRRAKGSKGGGTWNGGRL